MAEESITLEQGAKRLVDLILAAPPEARERIALRALQEAKIAAYKESLIALRFHASDIGQGLTGLAEGLSRALRSAEAEARDV